MGKCEVLNDTKKRIDLSDSIDRIRDNSVNLSYEKELLSLEVKAPSKVRVSEAQREKVMEKVNRFCARYKTYLEGCNLKAARDRNMSSFSLHSPLVLMIEQAN
ncbi:hypothetical protein PRIPAC_72208 [Pristionchus pacificus]|uniref:Uncharacterized protein n=1 Tax=Pristionchus pacificus TaxID=54126 RepID=A0A2A6CF80_PRIPA|nr:hypothetical protein PRIPAC_72208 [Pristionchus pacificus]|eukprot:PDM76852.1 hypothetical protein PRIPAC_42247 [Pristionchus pacificus]